MLYLEWQSGKHIKPRKSHLSYLTQGPKWLLWWSKKFVRHGAPTDLLDVRLSVNDLCSMLHKGCPKKVTNIVKHIFDAKKKTLGCPTKSTPAWGPRLTFINDIFAQGVSIVKSWQNILDKSSDILWKLIWTTLSGTVKVCGGAVFIITAAEPVLERLWLWTWCALSKTNLEAQR